MSTIRRPHWSYSQLAQFLRCPLQYYFERLARLPRSFLPSSLALGAAVHEAIADSHRRLMTHQAVPDGAIRDTFLAAWQTKLGLGTIQYRRTESAATLRHQGVALVELYLQEPPPRSIRAVEQPLVVPIEHPQRGYLKKPLVAVLDLVVDTAQGAEIQEFKTSSRRYAEASEQTCWQAICYRYAYQTNTGQAAQFRYRVLLKQRVPQLQSVCVPADPETGRLLAGLVTSLERAILQRTFFPIESPQNCSSCAYRTPCREWQTGRWRTRVNKESAC